MKSKKGIILLFILGLSIFIYPFAAQWINGYLQKKQVDEFQDGLEGKTDVEIEKLMETAASCNEEIYYDSDGLRDPFGDEQEKLQKFQKCLGIQEEDIFAAVEIPKLKLVIPIYIGASDEILSKGIGQIEGSSLPIGGKSTHTVLAGHRGMGTKEMFRNIDQLHDNDIFYIHTMNETLTYRVFRQKIIYPHETDSLEIVEDKDLATLFTCHPYRYNHQRLLIQGERVK